MTRRSAPQIHGVGDPTAEPAEACRACRARCHLPTLIPRDPRSIGNMISVRAVVFDLDGTLFDHVTSARLGLRSWLLGAGVALTDELEAAWFQAEEVHHNSWRHGLVSWEEQRRRRLRDFLPLLGWAPGSDDHLDRLFREGFLAGYREAWTGFDDVDDGLTALGHLGFDFAILTNGTEQQQRDKLAHLGLLDRVGQIFTAEGLGVAKPNTRAFHAVCEALDLPADEVLYVGDDYPTDVVASRAAGLQAIHLDRNTRGSTPTDDRVATITELSAVVTRTHP
jgi:putative hydrolase of the HAD superfamily